MITDDEIQEAIDRALSQPPIPYSDQGLGVLSDALRAAWDATPLDWSSLDPQCYPMLQRWVRVSHGCGCVVCMAALRAVPTSGPFAQDVVLLGAELCEGTRRRIALDLAPRG